MSAVTNEAGRAQGGFPQWMLIVAAVLALGRLVLVSHDEIVSYGSDDTGYAMIASRWYWGSEYGLYTYTRPPTYPLFVAASSAMGVPQRLMIELVWIGASAAAMLGLRRCGVRPLLALGAYAIVLLDPLTLTLLNRLLSDGLCTACVVVLVSATGAVLCAKRRGSMWRWSAVAAVAAALVTTTRAEGPVIWMFLGGAACLAVVLRWWAGKGEEGGPRLGWRALAAVFVPFVAAQGLAQVYSYVNLRTIGIYGTNDILTPGFRAMYRALLSIPPERPELLLSVPRDVREKAYAVSPTFAKLRPFLDGAIPVPDGRFDCQVQTGVSGEYGAWTYWALRAAAWRAHEAEGGGWYTSAGEMEKFFQRAADEIERGMKERGMARRWAPLDFVPPEWGQLAEQLPRAAWRNCRRLAHRDVVRTAPEVVSEEAERAFDAAALRRAVLVKISRGEVVERSGWFSPSEIGRLDRIKRAVGRVQSAMTPVAAAMAAVGGVVGLVRLRRLDARGRSVVLMLWVCVLAIVLRLAFVSLLDATGVLFTRVVDAAGQSAAAPEVGGPPVQSRYLLPISAGLGMVMVLGIEAMICVWKNAAAGRRGAGQS